MATGTQGIQEFYAQAHSKDFARTFQFRIQELGALSDPNILIYLESTSLPGRSIANIPVPFMGLQFNVPGTASYPGSDSWTVTFRCDQNYDLRGLLEDASFNIFDDQISGGTYKTPPPSQNIVLNLLGKDITAAPIRQYSLIGAYLVNIGETAYDVGDNGTIVKIQCTMAYQYWRVTNANPQNVPGSRLKNIFPF